MSDVQNLNSHYTTTAKVDLSRHSAIAAPSVLPSKKTFDNDKANARWKAVNSDIYQSVQKEKKSSFVEYLKFSIALLVAALGIKYAYKFFKKS